MHSEVAGGKYVRTKWTGGEYDTKVIFESDEDFNNFAQEFEIFENEF